MTSISPAGGGNGVFDETCAGCRRTARVDVNIEDAPGATSILSTAISGDGQVVAFTREFSTFAPPPDEDVEYTDRDVFVHDLRTGLTRRVSVDQPGVRVTTEYGWDIGTVVLKKVDITQSPGLCYAGLYVVFDGNLEYSYSGYTEHVFVEYLGG